MEDKKQEESNIDDLEDYNDFDNGADNLNNDQDSFNKDIMKIYEDHKKSIEAKTNEAYNQNRPISSYQRLSSPVIVDSKHSGDNKVNDNGKNSSSLDKKDSYEKMKEIARHRSISDIIERLNAFLLKNKITQNDFCDNSSIFLRFDDFKELFNQMRYDINLQDALALFDYKNELSNEGYIHMCNFLTSNEITFYSRKNDIAYSKSTSNNNIIIESSPTISTSNALNQNQNQYEIKKLNDQFNQINQEIKEIIKNDMIEELNKKLSKRVKTGISRKKESRDFLNDSSKLKALFPGKVSSLSNSNLCSNDKSKEQSQKKISEKLSIQDLRKSSAAKQRYDVNKSIEEMLIEQEEEKKNIKNTLEKKTKKFIKDCIFKIAEANKICEELGIKTQFTRIEKDGEIYCLVQENTDAKEDQPTVMISLKAFLVRWRILNKKYIQFNSEYNFGKDLSKAKLDQQKSTMEKTSINIKFNKKERLNEIKDVLVKAIQLKMKLKSQIDALKRTVKIDEKQILDKLREVGLYQTNS